MLFHCFWKLGNSALAVFFNPFSSNVVIALSSPVGLSIINVTATDGDQANTENSVVFFALEDPTLPFAIDSISGLLSTRQEDPDLIAQTYTIEVVAEDRGTPPLSSTGTIIVNVAPPNFFSPAFPPDLMGLINENDSPMGVLFSFVVTDDDTGSEGEVSVVLLPRDFSSNFTISNSPVTGGTRVDISYLGGPGFDRELINNFTLYLLATDQGNQLFRKSMMGTFLVEVVDANDNPPVYVGAPYSTMVSEGAQVGLVIATVRATDADEGTNAAIGYSLNFNGREFVIDSESGNISVDGPLLVSDRDFFQIQIAASDGVFTVNTYINITITEVNDNAPQFNPLPPPTVTFPENTPVGTTLLNVSVSDADTGISGEAMLSLLQTEDIFGSGMYSTNEFYIYLQRIVDFEVSQLHSSISLVYISVFLIFCCCCYCF